MKKSKIILIAAIVSIIVAVLSVCGIAISCIWMFVCVWAGGFIPLWVDTLMGVSLCVFGISFISSLVFGIMTIINRVKTKKNKKQNNNQYYM